MKDQEATITKKPLLKRRRDAALQPQIKEKGMTDLFDKCRGDGGYFGYFRSRNDMFFSRPVLGGIPGPRMKYQGKEVIMWAINNYMGLAGNEEVKEAARKSLEQWGTFTPMGSRMLTGNTDRHIELERKLADYLQKPAAALFNYGNGSPEPRQHRGRHDPGLCGETVPTLQAQRHASPGASSQSR
jgi:7-keto-8-aminopelargonate synthetase-like enzyme